MDPQLPKEHHMLASNYSYSSGTMNPTGGNRSSAIPTPRIPSVNRSHSFTNDMPTLSPRTPNISSMEFPNIPKENTDSALKAIDLFANTLDPNKALQSPPDFYPTGLLDNMNSTFTDTSSNFSAGNNYPIEYRTVSEESGAGTQPKQFSNFGAYDATHKVEYTSTDTAQINGKKSQPLTAAQYKAALKTQQRRSHPMQTLRKQHLSLDPTERENLEKLVEDVLIGGLGEGVIDSDGSSSDDSSPDGSSLAEGATFFDEETLQKLQLSGELGINQSQLKVAAKHMKNLPPRFMKRLGKPSDNAENFDPLKTTIDTNVLLKMTQAGQQGSRKQRYLLEGMDVYADEDQAIGITRNDSYIESRDTNAITEASNGGTQLRNVYTSPSVLSSKLDKNLSKPTSPSVIPPSAHPHHSVIGGVGNHIGTKDHLYNIDTEKKTSFSIDAPEFVPRSKNESPANHTNPKTTPSLSFLTSSPDVLSGTNTTRMLRSSSPYHQPVGRLSPHAHMLGTHLVGQQGRNSPVPYLLPPRNSPVSVLDRSSPSLMQQSPYVMSKVPMVHVPSTKVPLAPAAAIPVPASYTSPYTKLHHPYAMNPVNAAAVSLSSHYKHLGYLPHVTHPQRIAYPAWTLGEKVHSNYIGRTASPAKINLPPSTHGKNTLLVTAEKPKITTDQQAIDMVKAVVDSKRKIMIILRGCPGSGKSYLAKLLQMDGVILSSDDFFTEDGKYQFNFSKLGEAHEWNQKRALEAATQGKNPIIIDNTNSQLWEMKAYAKAAYKNGYQIEVLEPNTTWKFSLKELVKRNVHGINEPQIQKMIDRYEPHITGQTLLTKFGPEQLLSAGGEGENGDVKKKKRRRRRKRGRGKNKSKLAASEKDKDDKEGSSHSEDEEDEPTEKDKVALESQTSSEGGGGAERGTNDTDKDSTGNGNNAAFMDIIQEDSDNEEVALINKNAYTISLNGQSDASKDVNKIFTRSMSLPNSEDRNVCDVSELSYWQSNHPIKDPYEVGGGSGGGGNSVVGGYPVSTATAPTAQPNLHTRMRSQLSWSGDPAEFTLGKPRRDRSLKTQESKQDDWELDLASSLPDQPVFLSPSTNGHVDSSSTSTSTPQTSPAGKTHYVKQQRYRHETISGYPSVRLDRKVTDKLLASDWNIPLFNSNAPTRPTKSKGCASQATDGDFYMLSRALESNNLDKVKCLGYISVLCGEPSRFVPSRDLPVNKTASHTGNKLMLDKSSTTDDLLLTSLAEGIEFLHGCFPEIAQEELAEILEYCDNDLEWAMQLLLASSDGEHLVNFGSLHRTSNLNDKLVCDSSNVPCLAFLCNKVLFGDGPMDPYIVQEIADMNVKRLQFIANYHGGLAKSSEERTHTESVTKEPIIGKTDVSSEMAVTTKGHQDTIIEDKGKSVECESELDVSAEDIVIHLDDYTAVQLVKLFGPLSISDETDGSLGDEHHHQLQVRLDHNTAQAMYNCWRRSVQEGVVLNQSAEMNKIIRGDEELARRLAEDEEPTETFPPLPVQKKPGSAKVPATGTSNGTNNVKNSLATTIKRVELQKRFPCIEPDVLEEVFKECGYSYEAAVQCLGGSTSNQHSTQDEDVEPASKSVKKVTFSQPLSASGITTSDEAGVSKIGNSSTQDNNTTDVNRQLDLHQELRYQCYQKAKDAYTQGMRGVATFYSQQAQVHAEKVRTLSQQRTAAIVEEKKVECDATNEVDLHGLSVSDALAAVEGVIQYRRHAMKTNSNTHRIISLITGWGKRSVGLPKLRPAVLRYLQTKGYRYTEPSLGLLKVSIM